MAARSLLAEIQAEVDRERARVAALTDAQLLTELGEAQHHCQMTPLWDLDCLKHAAHAKLCSDEAHRRGL